MEDKQLIQRLTSVYQMLDQVKCDGHQNHRYLTVSMDNILDLIQNVQRHSASAETGKMSACE